jgi:hypothetical protein
MRQARAANRAGRWGIGGPIAGGVPLGLGDDLLKFDKQIAEYQ